MPKKGATAPEILALLGKYKGQFAEVPDDEFWGAR
jgi:hypothetical protein